MQKNIKLNKFAENKYELLKKSDILIVSSQSHESFGLVIIEAMSAGVPVIANNVGGDLFISIHANAANQKARGFETFLLRIGKTQDAIEVAKLIGTPINDIIENYNQLLDFDVTIILGKDYNKLTKSYYYF